jgi:hypothetical protein
MDETEHLVALGDLIAHREPPLSLRDDRSRVPGHYAVGSGAPG